LAEHKIEEFSAGPFHTLALSTEGLIFAFGNSNHDKLGFINREA
jgi:alpha-tubulin suppressor-like RCC1 family protein